MPPAPLRPAAPKARTAPPPARSPGSAEADLRALLRELGSIAEYIAHVKAEIGALRATELQRDRIPMAHEELGSVLKATASATHTIMAAAEAILGSAERDPARYRAEVETHVLEIFEACSFQDITGQRIAKVVEALSTVEKRLGRFVSAVNIRDGGEADPEERLREARREALLLNGPAAEGKAIAQDDIDAMFD